MFFICRSGVRSMRAAQAVSSALSAKGTPVDCINVAEGFEGDLDERGRRGGLQWLEGPRIGLAPVLKNESERAETMTSETWNLVKGEIEKDVGANNFAAWIKPLQFRSLDQTTLSLASPTDFIGRWVVQHFSDVILRHASDAGIDATRILCGAAPAPCAAVR